MANEAAERCARDDADRLQALSRRVLEVQEDERRRLACELHDVDDHARSPQIEGVAGLRDRL